MRFLIQILRWWSLRPYVAAGVPHFDTSTEDGRHFHYLHCYWDNRLVGFDHAMADTLAKHEVESLQAKQRSRRATTEVAQDLKGLFDGLQRMDDIMDDIEARRASHFAAQPYIIDPADRQPPIRGVFE